MATARQRAPVGSAQWIHDETKVADQYVSEEVEEFSFSARNEMEWLNEHMAEIFSRKQFEVSEIFKTPGKLRGKTPRTARKAPGSAARIPLGDMFTSSNQKAPAQAAFESPKKGIAPPKILEDKENITTAPALPSRSPARLVPQHKLPQSQAMESSNTDSGYHEMTDHEEQERPRAAFKPVSSVPTESKGESRKDMVGTTTSFFSPTAQMEATWDSQESFVSAEESQGNKKQNRQGSPGQKISNVATIQKQLRPNAAPESLSSPKTNELNATAEVGPVHKEAPTPSEPQSPADARRSEDLQSPSEASSPENHHPLLRKKSSLNFASLPAREPLNTNKKSAGARISQPSNTASTGSLRTSTLSSKFGPGKNLTVSQPEGAHMKDEDLDADDHKPARLVEATEHAEPSKLVRVELPEQSEDSRLYSKTSTQRLHEKISLLGKSNASRSSKSIPSAPVVSFNTGESRMSSTKPMVEGDEGDDEWIEPMRDPPNPQSLRQLREAAAGDQSPKAASSVVSQSLQLLQSPPPQEQQQQPKQPSNSEAANFQEMESSKDDIPRSTIQHTEEIAESTGPPASASKWQTDGPLSASKAKFNSFLKSARGMFASSAASSAQAKVEMLSSNGPGPRAAQLDELSHTQSAFKTLEGSPPKTKASIEEDLQTGMHQGLPQGEMTRRSSQRLRDREENKTVAYVAEGVEEEQTRSRQTEADMVEQDLPEWENAHPNTTDHEMEDEKPEIVNASNAENKLSDDELGSLQKTETELQSQKSSEARRPVKFNRPPSAANKPASVSIMTKSQRLGHLPPGPSGASNTGPKETEPSAPTLTTKPALNKKGSSSSIRTVSSIVSAKPTVTASSGRPKALEIAARKREQEEKQKQRRAEQKRQLDRKRAAKAEEEKRQAEEQKALEQQKAQDTKAAQKRAEEQRKAELQKRNDQLREQAEVAKRKFEADAAAAARKTEGDNTRPPSRDANHASSLRAHAPHINPAKPPKRYFQPDDDDEPARRAQPAQPAQSVAHNPAKRRKTSDEGVNTNQVPPQVHLQQQAQQPPTRPTMAPPVRLSTMRKQEVPVKFTHGYMANASASSAHQSNQSMLKSAVSASHNLQHPKTPHQMNDLAKYTSARIPFAEGSNPAGPSSATANSASHHYGPHFAQSSHHASAKTPGHPHSHHQPHSQQRAPAKSSPNYPPGDSIELPEIATDSEDEPSSTDTSPAFRAPSWAASPALRNLLAQQQLVDPISVFGPIAPLAMDEVFRGGSKERRDRFRQRTSSANWNGPDRLTEEERERDRRARVRLEEEGTWTMGNAV